MIGRLYRAELAGLLATRRIRWVAGAVALMITASFLVAWSNAGVNLLYGGDSTAFQRDVSMSRYIDVETPPESPASMAALSPLVSRAEREWGGAPALNIYISHPNRANAAVEVWAQREHRVTNFPARVAFDGVSGKKLRTLISRTPARDAQTFLAALHFVEWGGVWVRWLYFLAGLASTAMVAQRSSCSWKSARKDTPCREVSCRSLKSLQWLLSLVT